MFVLYYGKYCFQLIESACEEADDKVEPQPLWEYPAKARGHPIPLLNLNLSSSIPESSVVSEESVVLPGSGMVNGMALWADWHLTDQTEDTVTTGPVEPVVLDQYVSIYLND